MKLQLAGFALLCLVSAGCDHANPSDTKARAEGGVSGGGGGTVPSANVEPETVRAAIQQSRAVLALYFNDQTNVRRFAEVSSGAKLFDGPRTIFDVIATATLDLKNDGPCIDPHGEEKDGAAPGSTANSICISVSNLAGKLTPENVWSQSVALVGHELSHLLGTNEDEALTIQTDIIKTLARERAGATSDFRVGGFTKLKNVSWALEVLEAGVGQRLQTARDINLAGLEAMKNLETLLNDNWLFGNGLALLNVRELDLWWAAYWKTHMLSFYACGQDHSYENAGRDQICADNYDRLFGTDATLDLPTIEARMNSGARSQNPPGYAIHRITNETDFVKEIAESEALLAQLEDSVDRLPRTYSSFDPSKSPAVPSNNSVVMKTNRVTLAADDFHIAAGGQMYYGSATRTDLHSDPGGQDYWTLESTWIENGRPMRLFIYFTADRTHWWATQIRIYDGSPGGQWVFFTGHFFESPLGSSYNGDLDLANGHDEVHFRNLKLRVDLH